MSTIENHSMQDDQIRSFFEQIEVASVPTRTELGRRSFLKFALAAGGGFALAFRLDASAEAPGGSEAREAQTLNAFVKISADNKITLYSKGPEIGQGIKTAFGLIIAEELDADWATVTVEQAPVKPKIYGSQSAGGSTSIPRGWDQLRMAGATARAMLVAAAAEEWNVSPDSCSAANSIVQHAASGRKATYGALAVAAGKQKVPDSKTVRLKNRDEYRLLGKRFTGVDNRKVVTGTPIFGIDAQMPGMIYANYVKCPAVGGKVKSANYDAVKKLPGVIDVFPLEGTGVKEEVMPGVVILAKSTWQAFKAKAALNVEWDESTASKDSTKGSEEKAKACLPTLPTAGAENRGDVAAAFGSAAKTIEATYDYAMVSHQQLEPGNTTAWWHDGIMEMWTPSQMADRGLTMVAGLLKLPEDKVVIHQTRAGGGFGRRLMNDYLCEAAMIAMKSDAPVKVQWKREDDFAHDFYRVGGYHALKGALDGSGKMTAVQMHTVGFSADGRRPANGSGRSAGSFPIDIAPNAHYTQTLLPWQTPCGWWRAPTENVQVFVQGSFLHEMSLAAGRDHLEFLIDWLKRPIVPRQAPPGAQQGRPEPGAPPARPAPTITAAERAVAVVTALGEKAGWGRKLPAGHGLGIAYSYAFGGHVAEAVELSVDAKKHITIHKITVVADVGPVVNMSGAENQVQGGVIDALSTVMGLEVGVENGRIKQTNFHEYPLLRMQAAPVVEAYFLQPDVRPSGLGEPCVPPLAPALGNAIFAATGERIRTMPFKRAGYTI